MQEPQSPGKRREFKKSIAWIALVILLIPAIGGLVSLVHPIRIAFRNHGMSAWLITDGSGSMVVDGAVHPPEGFHRESSPRMTLYPSEGGREIILPKTTWTLRRGKWYYSLEIW